MNHIELSKTLSHALRHAPESYNLTLDQFGWVKLSDLEDALVLRGIKTTSREIIEVVESSQKMRHEINGDQIRACYGHTLPTKIVKVVEEPPELLFHGTSRAFIVDIEKNGLLPMMRQYVHLSSNVLDAKTVALRKGKEIVIISVLANKAFKEGVEFFKEKSGIWLSNSISPDFLIINEY